MSGWVDRIVFAHDRSLDFVAVASSLPTPERDKWTEIVRGHVLVSHARRPPASMWYWTEGCEAALLWRIASPGDGRADLCHALVGPADTLDSVTALALHDWPGWTGDEWRRTDTPPVEGATLPVAVSPERSVNGYLLAIVRVFLLNPDRPMSIVTDALTGKEKVRLVQDATAIVGTLLGANPQWTFSTFETRHDESVSRLPRIVFLPSDHEESRSHPVTRSVLELPPAPVLDNDFYQSMAERLGQQWCAGGVPGLTNWLTTLDVLNADGPRDRVNRLCRALDATTTPGRRHTPVVPPTDVELVRRLAAQPRDSVDEVLAEIARRKVASDAERNAVLRLVLASHALVWADKSIDTLVRFAIDPRDWHDAGVVHELDQAIANPATSPQLERALIRAALTNDAWTSLARGLATNHLNQLGFAVSYPEGPPEPAPVGDERRTLWLWIAVVAVLFAALIFLIS